MSGSIRVGFIGAGKMASALARGFAKTLPTGAKTISASCPPADAYLLDELKDMGCNTMHSNEDLVKCSDVVLLAVKPTIVPIVLKEVKHLIGSNKLLVSIAAGLRINQMEKDLDTNSKVYNLCY
jgi:pyrroline-5-carboxylate reductase